MSNDEGRSISTSAESPLATTAGWRREIMRLHELVTGKKIWAGASITKRQDGRVVRINAPSPTGKASLTQRQIARWPHAVRGLHWGSL
jgi:hypothetical protein